jgi:hypothetical protein
MIRTARRGALLSAVLLGGVTAIAALLAPEAAGRPLTVPVAITAMAIPALALLGAALAPTAVGSRVDAVLAGVAFAIGAPVAAALSTATAVFVVVGVSDYTALTGLAVGEVIRMGVTSAVRVAPLVGSAALTWVLTVRLLGRRNAVLLDHPQSVAAPITDRQQARAHRAERRDGGGHDEGRRDPAEAGHHAE